MVRFLLLLLLAAGAASAQPAEWPPAPTHLDLRAASYLPQTGFGAQLNRGVEAVPTKWPATFFPEHHCTATLIAARTLLLAAHCIRDRGTVTLEREADHFDGDCDWPKDKDGRTIMADSRGTPVMKDSDYALCLMRKPVPVEDGYENVGLRLDRLGREQQLLLTGYGCTTPGGVSDGTFRTGPAFVEHPAGTLRRYPPTMLDYPNWLATYAAARTNDAFLCEGDSGGGVYLELGGGLPRQLVAVNSSFDAAGQGISYLSVLGTPFAEVFLEQWSLQHGQRLCGMHDDAQNCRTP